MHIGKYYRVGYTCLGVSKHQLITFGNGRKSRKAKPLDVRYFGKENVRTVKTLELNGGVFDLSGLASVASGEGGKIGDNLPYIAISEMGEEGGRSNINPLGIYDSSTELYMQGRGPMMHEQKASGRNSVKASQEELQKRKTADYNCGLTNNPHDEQKWLEFIDFQDELITYQEKTDSVGHRQKKHAPSQVLYEIKSAIFDRALEKNPSSVKLKIAQLEFAAAFWDSAKLAAEWKQLMFTHMNDGALWRRYLLFAQSQFSAFSVSAVLKLYAKCFETLSGLCSGNVQSHPLLPGTTGHMIEIFVQLCHLLRQSGHTEKAVSLFQAQLEFTFFCPPVLLSASLKDKREFLETFWDSSAPRFGEVGAGGWDAWMERKGDVEPLVPINSSQDDDEAKEADLLKANAEKWQKWLALEAFRQDQHWLPWRPDVGAGETEDDCTDPDRVVLSTDIIPYIFSLGSNEPGKFSLLCRFLHFLGIPEMSDRHTCHEDDFNLILEEVQQVRCALPSDCGTVFDRSMSGGDVRFGVDAFVSNIVTQCATKVSNVERTKLSLMLIAFKLARINGGLKAKPFKEVKKFTKSLMKEPHHRNNLALWEAYARLEWDSGDVAKARKVLDSALAMATEDTRDARHQRCLRYLLHRSYSEMELGLSSRELDVNVDRQRALHVLIALADGQSGGRYEPFSGASKTHPTAVLKSRNVYKSHLDELLTLTDSEGSWSLTDDVFASYAGDEILHCTVCYAMFEYITRNIEAASLVFEHVLGIIRERIASETSRADQGSQPSWDKRCHKLARWLTESHVTLLFYHTKTQVAPLHIVRGPLEAALKEFPTDVRLLRCYVALEARSNIAGRLRRYFHRATKSCPVALLWLFAIYAEVRRMQLLAQYSQQVEPQIFTLTTNAAGVTPLMTCVETGTSHHLRALFERATYQEGVQHCVLLWRLYMNFEMGQGRKDAARAVFYRALQQCPWAKVLYTDLARLCPDRLTEAVNLIEEKELRLRTPVEELDLLMSLATEQSNEKEQQQPPTLTTNVDVLAPLATEHHGDGQEHDVAMVTSNVDLPLASAQHLDNDEENCPTLSKDGTRELNK